MLESSSGNIINLSPTLSFLLTGNLSSNANLLDQKNYDIIHNSDWVYELWIYFRLNHPRCIELFPNNLI